MIGDDVFVATAGDAEQVAHFVDGFGGVASSSQSIQCHDSRIIPSIDQIIENQLV